MMTVLTLNTLRDRYPTADERDRLTAYSAGIRDRLAAVREIEVVEWAVIEVTLDRIGELYPNFTRYHAVGWEKGYRDMQLMLQFIAKAMLVDDQRLLDDQVLTWVRSIFKSLNFTPKFLRDSYTLLRESVRVATKPRTFALMEPLLTHTIHYLSDIPEPVRPEV